MKSSNKTSENKAFTIVELLVVAATIAVISLLALQFLTRPRIRSARIQCVNNLKNVGLAFRVFSTDHQDHFPMSISTNKGGTLEYASTPFGLYRTLAVLSNELSTPRILRCPEDMTQLQATDFRAFAIASTNELHIPPGVSYFFNQYADEMLPRSVLAGDRNITNDFPSRRDISKGERIEFNEQSHPGWTAEIHNNRGNVALGDGSVQQINTAAALRSLLNANSSSSNRTALLFPGKP